MKVKICGIQNEESALKACQYGADALGFVFAKSRRQVTKKEAEKIIKLIPNHILKIGVFVNEERSIVREIYEKCGLQYVQLHGDETEEYVNQLNLPTIKAFSISSIEDVKRAEHFPANYILVDSPREAYYGGNGTSFDWHLLQESRLNRPYILAGGLTVENISTALKITKPFMIDVSSGVETNGQKDFEKIRRFIQVGKGGR